MVQVKLKIDGMMCGMCESHLNDAVRSNFHVKKITSSHKSGIMEIVAENEIDIEKLKGVITSLGYTVLSYEQEPYEKKKSGGLFGLFHK